MATDKPKLQGYVERELLDRFTQWKSERGIDKDSAALNELLREFFGVPRQAPAPPEITEERLRIAIQEELWSSGKRDFIDGIKLEAEKLIAQKVSESQAYWESREIISQVTQRLERLENQMSNPPSNLPSNLPSDTEALSELADDYGELHDQFQELESRVSNLENAVPVDGRSPSDWHNQEEGLPSELPSNPLPPEKPNGLSITDLSGAELARRLRVDPATLIKNRSKSDFEKWAKAKDPQSLAWRYAADTKRYESVD
jgi:hypothetical protein